MPPYQVRGRLLKSGMTEKTVYGQTLNIDAYRREIRKDLKREIEIMN